LEAGAPCHDDAIVNERAARTSLARWVSVLGHPFVMAGVLSAAVATRLSPPAEAARTVALVLLVSVVPVAVLMIRQVRRGSWEHVDASHRSERPVLFLVAAVSLLALAGIAFALQPRSFLIRGALGTLAMVAVCAVATRWLKVSLHMAFAALATTLLLALGSIVGWLLLALMPLLAWSRLYLGRHTPAEVVAGVVAGAIAGFALYRL
jgi:membrane-associated phospholipid phosphatase